MFVPPPPPPTHTHTLLTHFYFPLELYVYITLTINYFASFIYQLIILWKMFNNHYVNNHIFNYIKFILLLYRRYINVCICVPPPPPPPPPIFGTFLRRYIYIKKTNKPRVMFIFIKLTIFIFNRTLYVFTQWRSTSVTRCTLPFCVAHGAMGRRIDPSWGGPIELFLVPASAPRLV